jgi:hypothetical protein
MEEEGSVDLSVVVPAYNEEERSKWMEFITWSSN